MQGIYTKAVHAGEEPDPTSGALSTPIYQTNAYLFPTPEEGARRIAAEGEGWVYTRWGNPTVAALERKIATLEGGEAALAASSGMGAISTALLTLAAGGDHIVAPHTVYGGTHHLMASELPKMGIETTFVDATDPENVEEAVRENTRILYIETPGNPNLDIVDIAAMVEIAKEHGLHTVADNTFATPILQNPLALGVDVVVHSATKYLGGHGDAVAGVIVGSEDFIKKARSTVLRHFGASLGPFEAWLILRGMQTLPLRVERHSTNALAVAQFLEGHPKVERVFYPGLPSHPQHALAKRQMRSFGGMLSFEVRSGIKAGEEVMRRVRLCTLAVSLGDVRTLISHPASMTHAPNIVPREERRAAGIGDGLIRLSVGLEDPSDIIADLDQALLGI
ncbi:MAG: PLP-dependent transferase [Chloroflexi bacterium]|nr:PLP-dependent transferase [Chloroflexota bacterium]